MYFLDTNTCIYFLNGSNDFVEKEFFQPRLLR